MVAYSQFTMTPGAGIDVSTYDPSTLRIENLSTDGIALTQVRIDLGNAILPDGIFFDPFHAGGSSGKAFTIDGKVGTFTATASYADGSDATGYKTLIINFTDFNPGEVLNFSIDIDPDSMRGYPLSVNPGGISGAEAAGSLVTFVYSDGTTQTAELMGTGVAQAVADSRPVLDLAPTLTIGGVSGNITVPDATTSVTVTGVPGTIVRVQIMTTQMQVVAATDPFDANSATAVTYQIVTLGADGSAVVSVTMVPDRVMVVAAAAVDAQGIVSSHVSPELKIIRESSAPPPASLAIDTGGSGYTDGTGLQYATDSAAAPSAALTGSSTARTTASAIANTTDDALYQSYRFGQDFGYNINLANGTYTVELQFVEPYFNAAGQRVFDVHLEGQEVASNVDVWAAAQGRNIAYTLTRNVTVTDGQLNIGLESTGADDVNNAILSGLLIRPSDPPPPPPPPASLAIDTGGSGYTDGTGLQYATDSAAAPNAALTGSSTARTTASAIANTTDDALYQSYRFGQDFGYNINLANGTYTVELQFVEPYFNAAGQRMFDVHLEGQEVASNVDVWAAAQGRNIAYTLTRNVTVTDGQLNIGLESTGADDVNNAILSGLLIRPSDPPPPPPPPPPASLAIDTGGSGYTDGTGLQYATDSAAAPNAALKGSSTARTTASAIANTTDDALYQSYRFGQDFGYNINLANGTYTVELQFVEPYFNAAGQRVFDVHLEGQEVASNVDVWVAAQGRNIAYTVTRNVTVTDGQLNIGLESTGADDVNNAILSGLLIRSDDGAVLHAADDGLLF